MDNQDDQNDSSNLYVNEKINIESEVYVNSVSELNELDDASTYRSQVEDQQLVRQQANNKSNSQGGNSNIKYKKIVVLALILIILASLILIAFKINSLNLTSRQDENETLKVQIQNYSLCIILSQNIFNPDSSIDSNHYLPTLKSSLFSQSYKNWNLIGFTQQQNIQKGNDLFKLTEAQLSSLSLKITDNFSSSDSNKFNIMKSLRNKGQNIYNAIHHHCKNDSIIILLNQGDTFTNNESLNIINQHFNLKNNYMTTLQIMDIQEEQQRPSTGVTTYQRVKLYVDNRTIQQMKTPFQIIRFTRCFRAYYYKQIYYSQIMNQKRQFLNSSFSFLLILSENFQFKVDKPINHFALPSKFSMINQTLIKQNYDFKKFITSQEIQQIRCIQNKFTLQNYNQYYITKTHALNITNMHAQNKRRIPKIIHQIQIGNRPMTQFYKYLRSKIQLLMPEYQYRLWTEDNITVQNFPHSYKYIQRLFQINKTFQYSRISMVVDLMKLEVIYLHGGIYLDKNVEILQSLDGLTNLAFFSGRQDFPAHPYVSVGNFGAQKNSSIIAKLMTQKSLSNIDLRSKSPHVASGPGYLGSAIQFQEYYNGEIFVYDPQVMYPYQKWKGGKLAKCACAISINQRLMPHMTSSKLEWIEQGDFKVIKNCPFYKYSISVDYFMFGGSWKKKKVQSKQHHN